MNKASSCWAVLSLFLLSLGVPAVSAHGIHPGSSADKMIVERFVGSSIQCALDVVNDSELTEEQALARFAELLEDYFDLDKLVNFSFGQHARTLDPASKGTLRLLINRMLIATYAGNFKIYKGAKFAIRGAQQLQKGIFNVPVDISVPGKSNMVILVTVRQDKEGQRKIIDISWDGISLRSLLREQVSGSISELGPKRAMEKFEQIFGPAGK
ncbi:MAG: ABC transporter substrate-binding protein [Holosporaceae bacterium]|jgi:ABC-type transporter MlaC component|nr:ABC transporter substrate-binding protein [Holosporaceae bacterium]